MKKGLTPIGKVLVVLIIGIALFCGYWFFLKNGILAPKVSVSKTTTKIDLPSAPKNAESTVGPLVLPSDEKANLSGKVWTMWEMEWNSQMGLNLANGGPQTTKGSLMEKHSLNLNIERQDDYGPMANSLLDFATSYRDNPEGEWKGIQFCNIMGDGAPQFLFSLNKNLEKLGKEYRAEIIFTCGRSFGEDKLMGTPAMKEDPQKLRGSVIAGVVRDGDWNIAVQYASANNIPVNPDPTTYDADAMNFQSVGTYLDAANNYINDVKETRKIVKSGKLTGKTIEVVANGIVTWTPGDVNAVEQKGGLVTLASTKDYPSQMPNTIISIHKFNEDHAAQIEELILAVTEGGDFVKSYSEALAKAGEISSLIYNDHKEAHGAYWKRYYNGAPAIDGQTGEQIFCGGSMVHNLADNFAYFGLNGGTNIYKVIYNTFGSIDTFYYKDLMPTYPDYSQVVNLRFLRDLQDKTNGTEITAPSETNYNSSTKVEKVSSRSWSINFETGSSQFLPDAIAQLNDLYAQCINGMSLYLTIEGHTDATGVQSANDLLAQQRAEAVKNWLQKKDQASFPEKRFIKVQGFADRSTRRVDITMSRPSGN